MGCQHRLTTRTHTSAMPWNYGSHSCISIKFKIKSKQKRAKIRKQSSVATMIRPSSQKCQRMHWFANDVRTLNRVRASKVHGLHHWIWMLSSTWDFCRRTISSPYGIFSNSKWLFFLDVFQFDFLWISHSREAQISQVSSACDVGWLHCF